MEKQTILIAQSSHLDLYWMAAQAECLEIGAGVVDDAINRALADEKFHFVVEAARFAEYYLHKHPGRLEDFKKVLASGQIEIAACYTDRCEHFHDGEALVRNVQIGKRRLRALLGYDSKFAFHPDLPGFTEQTPQINKKMNVPFYFASRGFKTGVRALWEGPDGSSVVFYDFPKHYSYYEFGLDIIPYIGEIRKDTGMRDFLLLCSAGDCGPVGTFLVMDERKKPYRVNLTEMLAEVEAKYGVNCVYSGAYGALCKLDNTDLPVLKGESPNHWGANGSTTNVLMFQFDKKVTAALCDSEKYNAIARLLGPGAEPDKNETDRIMETFTSGKKRRYSIDMIQEPESAQQWLDFAWRLMCVTHDHNYSGIEASQSEFDRFMYKKTALRLSEHIIKRGQDAVLGGVQSAAGELVVFNTLNWAREELVRIPRGVMDPG
ncbi:MAG: hypothetical protein FWC55_09595, partial [Firmicutes bacterium]|nr:hypothetical protein [Bacillota bacterium]